MMLYFLVFVLHNIANTKAGVEINTSATYSYVMLNPYGINALSRTNIVFAVKACAHAHTALMSDPTDTTGTQYEIGIGGWENQRSFIRSEKQSKTNLAEEFHSPLNCTSFKIFWISWENGVISAGTGSISGQNVFMTYNFTTLNPINYLACSTYDGASGEWLYDLEDPVISTQLPVTGNEGDQVKLACNTSGYPAPTVVWTKGSTTLPGGDLDISVDSNNSLIIDNAHQSDNGVYTCGATNIMSSVSDDITLNISPINGGWSQWSVWSSCSVSCVTGTKTRFRACDSPIPSSSGSNCVGSASEKNSCIEMCNVNGSWTPWSTWSTCGATCGGGISYRSRTCTNPVPSGNGLPCTGNYSEDIQCSTNNCPVDGSWSPWSNFTSCNATCGGGIQRKYRTCSSPEPAFGGTNCTGEDSVNIACNTQNCTDTDDDKGCTCNCVDIVVNVTLEERLTQLRNILKVNKSTLSSTRRKLISVGDSRPSAERIGYFGVVLLCIIGAMLIFSDVKLVLSAFISKFNKCKQA